MDIDALAPYIARSSGDMLLVMLYNQILVLVR